jgi:hypothetical protein
MPEENSEAIELLYQNIGSLPDSEFGAINLLPFAVDSDQTNALKRKVCVAIVNLFQNNGFPMAKNTTPVEPERSVRMNCHKCSTTLLTTQVSNDGVANLPATAMIATFAKLNPECPHNKLTPEDHRRMIEEAVLASQGNND